MAEFREPNPVFPQTGRRQRPLPLQRQQRATQTLNLLALAASRGQTSTVDPTLAKLFADIRTAAATEGGIDSAAELNLEKYSYSPTGSQSRYFPTGRIDYNITPAHRLSGVFRWNKFGGLPDVLNGNEPAFPAFRITAVRPRSATSGRRLCGRR